MMRTARSLLYGGSPWTETPPGHVTCDACWDRDFPISRITDRCKNFALPQTSFAGGKKFDIKKTFQPETNRPLFSGFCGRGGSMFIGKVQVN